MKEIKTLSGRGQTIRYRKSKLMIDKLEVQWRGLNSHLPQKQ